MAVIAGRWHDAREWFRDKLVEDEGESTFEGRPGPPLDVPSPRARAARVEVRVASDAMM
jgi:hypothetical protein